MSTAQQPQQTRARKITDKNEIRIDELEVTYDSDGNAIDHPGADRSVVFMQCSLLPWKTDRVNTSVGPHSYAYQDPGQLSGVMQQRESNARTLAAYLGMLSIDKSFAALDYCIRLIMQEKLLNLWGGLSIPPCPALRIR